ncbi:hypothetical protein ACHAXR_009980 [Thalassiosira sp. AJA248-18]
MADDFSSQQEIQYQGSGPENDFLQYAYSDEDLFDGVAPSTVAMVILFGSIMFATVGMATRAWRCGDKRAIHAAISIKVDSTASNINSNVSSYSSVGDNQYGDNNSYSAASRISGHSMSSMGTQATTRIRPWEPTFISTFVLFYQASIFGLILFTVYLIDNHPPHGAARSQSTSYESSSTLEFDEDQFVFWLLILLAYTCSVSWGRNDGRPNSEPKSNPPRASKSPSVSSEAKSENPMRRRGPSSRSSVGSKSIGSKSSVSAASSEASDMSKRLEDVLLDDDSSFNNILDTIGSEINNHNDDGVGWMEQGSKLLGLPLRSENGDERTVQNIKPENDILNRCQTLEWKGILSASLLIYQYNAGGIHRIALNEEDGFYSEDDSIGSRAHVYENLTKVGMTSFLFLTGYGHTSYFYYHAANSNDCYRISRVLEIIFRINWTAIFLSLIIGKSEYMACPVNTYCFLLIWLTMRFQRSINYDKYLFRLKIFGLATCIFIIFDCDVSKIFRYYPVKKSFQSVWEWYCASHLHHWAAFCGMIFAINQPIASLQLRKLESLPILSNVMAKGIIYVALSAAVLVWSAGPLQMSRFAYNISHPYFGIIPVLAFIYSRNINTSTREHHIGVLSSLGKYSLEIYLLHHHAFTDTGCIVFIPGYPRCNFLLVSILLLFAARVLHHLTTILRHMLLAKDEESKCIEFASYTAAVIALLYTLARALSWADMVSFGTICTITIVCGILLYQTIVDMTWAEYLDSGVEHAQRYRSPPDPGLSIKLLNMVSPSLIAWLFVTAVCVWSFSVGVSQPCGATANNGHWISLNPCLSRGKLHREFHATNYIDPNECSEPNSNLQWAWLGNSQHTQCSYQFRADMEVRQKLQGKNVILIGDSSVRSLFQSLCRFMGDHNAAGYEDTTPSHSDSIKTYGSSTLEYKWAPLSIDIVTKLKSLKNSGFAAPMKRQPDLVITGGGAWDRLHLSVTDEDPQSQRETVTKLVKSLSKTDVPVVWFTPPTINTRALNSDEKRIQMSEESIQEMRQMYAELGVTSSVSFVLDGPSFTRERVAESFDGVHYPPSVYDAGTQILLNTLDWLLVTPNSAEVDLHLPKPGSLGVPYLGLMMICISLIGLFFFDGYFGFSYLAQIFAMNDSGITPMDLYDAALGPIFKRLKIQTDERVPDNSSDKGGDKEMTELIGRSSSSLSRRRAA